MAPVADTSRLRVAFWSLFALSSGSAVFSVGGVKGGRMGSGGSSAAGGRAADAAAPRSSLATRASSAAMASVAVLASPPSRSSAFRRVSTVMKRSMSALIKRAKRSLRLAARSLMEVTAATSVVNEAMVVGMSSTTEAG